MKYFIFHILMFLALFRTEPLMAFEAVISGQTKSQESFIRSKLERCLFETPTDQICEKNSQTEQCLMNSKLFAKVSISCDEKGVLQVNVEDRWTLLVIPFASVDSDKNKQYGAAVLDSNFLGQGKFVLAGVSSSQSRTNYVLIYNDPSLLSSRFTTGITINRAYGEIYRLASDRKTELDGFIENRVVIAPSLGYSFSDHLSGALNLRLVKREYKQIDSFETPPNLSVQSGGITLKFDYSNYKLYFQDGIFGQFVFNKDLKRSRGHSLASYRSGSISFQKALWFEHALQLQGIYQAIEGGNRSDLLRLPSSRGSRGLPTGSTWVNVYRSIAIDYQMPLSQFKHGVWTLAPFLDLGELDHDLPHQKFRYSTRGIGTYFYLKKVTAPGLGFEYGVNSIYSKSYASFTVGVSMG